MPKVLDPREKKIIFAALKTIKMDELPKLQAALIKAALHGESFPLECKEFSDLCSLHFHMKLEAVKIPLNIAIHKYIEVEILPLFQKMLNEEFDAVKWRSSFLLFLANDLKINVNFSTLVQMAIKEGKIYWRITSGDTVLYDRCTHKTPSILFNFSSAKLISMPWEQFRIFKDSGKRGGSVAITRERFVREFTARQSVVAADVWAELKAKGILDHNDRLSPLWHFTSSSNLVLDNQRISYPKIGTAFKKILEDTNNAERIACIPGASMYRPDRSVKHWADTTGRIIGLEPKSLQNKVKKWDVSIFQNLDNHALDGDGLDHDHIPSVDLLETFRQTTTYGFQLSIVPTTSTTEQALQQQRLAWIAEAKPETKKHWSCIAVPHSLHTKSPSFGVSKKAQRKAIEKPFLDEVRNYLDILEQPSEQKSAVTDKDDYLQALGAFRYMYRCQTKGKHGKVPQLFFHNTNKAEIDNLFYERLEKFTLKG